MTEVEKTICKIYLEDLDKMHSCNEYKLLMGLLDQEPCECNDTISRQAALDLCERFDGCVPYSVLSSYDMLPPVTPQPKTGHWLNVEDRTDWYDAVYKCSCCGREIIMPYELINNLYSDYPYCHCGAKMQEVKK